MNFDVVIIGAGPSGLSAGIRLAQMAQQQERELTICILEKGAEVGAHILSGAVIETRTLTELIPDWKEKDAPVKIEVKSDTFKYLTERGSFSLPTPPQMHNEGNYIISLGNLCRWLAEQASTSMDALPISEMVGAVVSTTFTVRVTCTALLPFASVTSYVIV